MSRLRAGLWLQPDDSSPVSTDSCMLEPANLIEEKAKTGTSAVPSDYQEDLPHDCFCPITLEVTPSVMADSNCQLLKALRDPVLASDGHSYERRSITSHLDNNNTSPITGQQLTAGLIPNHALRNVVQQLMLKVGPQLSPAVSDESEQARKRFEGELEEMENSRNVWQARATEATELVGGLRARVAELEKKLEVASRLAAKKVAPVDPVSVIAPSVPAAVVAQPSEKESAPGVDKSSSGPSVKDAVQGVDKSEPPVKDLGGKALPKRASPKARQQQKSANKKNRKGNTQPIPQPPAADLAAAFTPAPADPMLEQTEEDATDMCTKVYSLAVSCSWWWLLLVVCFFAGTISWWWGPPGHCTTPEWLLVGGMPYLDHTIATLHLITCDPPATAICVLGLATMIGTVIGLPCGTLIFTAVLVILGVVTLVVMVPSGSSWWTLLGCSTVVASWWVLRGHDGGEGWMSPLLTGVALAQCTAEAIDLVISDPFHGPFAELLMAVGLLVCSLGTQIEAEFHLPQIKDDEQIKESKDETKQADAVKRWWFQELLDSWVTKTDTVSFVLVTVCIDCVGRNMVVTGAVFALSAIRRHTEQGYLLMLVVGLLLNRAASGIASLEVRHWAQDAALPFSEPVWNFGALLVLTRLPMVITNALWWVLNFAGHRLLEVLGDSEVSYKNVIGWLVAAIVGVAIGTIGCYLYEQKAWSNGTGFWLAAVLHILGSGLAACATALVVAQVWACYLDITVVEALDTSCSMFVLATGLMTIATVFNSLGGDRSIWAQVTSDLEKRPLYYVVSGVVGLSGLLLAIFGAGMAFFVVVLSDLTQSVDMLFMLLLGLSLFFLGQQTRVDLVTLSGALLIVAWGAAGLWGLALGWGWFTTTPLSASHTAGNLINWDAVMNADFVWRVPLMVMTGFVWLVCCTDAFTLTHNTICHLANLTTTIKSDSVDSSGEDTTAATEISCTVGPGPANSTATSASS